MHEIEKKRTTPISKNHMILSVAGIIGGVPVLRMVRSGWLPMLRRVTRKTITQISHPNILDGWPNSVLS
jgi:hypothetical protein